MQLDQLIEPVAVAMRRAAATAILPRYRRLRQHEVQEKQPGEVVTEADREAEAMLTRELEALIPAARVVGEEAAAASPDLLHGLDDGFAWLVDPLDGTSNFVSGSDAFAVMVALLERGQTQLSWMLDPLTGSECIARKGHGAFKDGRRVVVPASAVATLGAGGLNGAILTRFLPTDVRNRVEQGRSRLGGATSGMQCAGAEYPAIALGQQDFALFWRTLPWDHAPGALFLTEAGGYVARPDGSPYRPGDGRSGLLAARSQAHWHAAHGALLA